MVGWLVDVCVCVCVFRLEVELLEFFDNKLVRFCLVLGLARSFRSIRFVSVAVCVCVCAYVRINVFVFYFFGYRSCFGWLRVFLFFSLSNSHSLLALLLLNIQKF